MDKFPILQSGFATFSEKGLIKPKITKDFFLDEVLARGYKKNSNIYFYHDSVQSLYEAWLANSTNLKSFDFREDIIKLALECFNNKSFYSWLKLQTNNDKLGPLHHQFILDTLQYLQLDRERNLQLMQWARLLDTNMSLFIMLNWI